MSESLFQPIMQHGTEDDAEITRIHQSPRIQRGRLEQAEIVRGQVSSQTHGPRIQNFLRHSRNVVEVENRNVEILKRDVTSQDISQPHQPLILKVHLDVPSRRLQISRRSQHPRKREQHGHHVHHLNKIRGKTVDVRQTRKRHESTHDRRVQQRAIQACFDLKSSQLGKLKRSVRVPVRNGEGEEDVRQKEKYKSNRLRRRHATDAPVSAQIPKSDHVRHFRVFQNLRDALQRREQIGADDYQTAQKLHFPSRRHGVLKSREARRANVSATTDQTRVHGNEQ